MELDKRLCPLSLLFRLAESATVFSLRNAMLLNPEKGICMVLGFSGPAAIVFAIALLGTVAFIAILIYFTAVHQTLGRVWSPSS